MIHLRTSAALISLALACGVAAAQPTIPATVRNPTLAAWESLRYGMFIHFGLNTFIAQECPGIDYDPALFRPWALDVDQWVRTAQEAGMTYAILTTKHCTGHCLWPSKLTNFTVAASPVKTDIVRAFVDACRARSIKPGLYYLLGWDTHHQRGQTPDEYEAFCTGQLTELLTDYGPIQQVFLDIPFDTGPDMSGVLSRLYSHIKQLQPDCLVLPNQAFSDGSSIARAKPQWLHNDAGSQPVPIWPRDLMNGERTLPPRSGHQPFITWEERPHYLPMEVCDTLTSAWFYHPGDLPRPLRRLYGLHQACMNRNANFILNVAPDRSGQIPQRSIDRLMELRSAIDAKDFPQSLAINQTVTASNTHRNDPAYAPSAALDNIIDSRWATDDNQNTAWLEVNLGREHSISSAYISECTERIRRFQLEVPDADRNWKRIARGERIREDGVELVFPAVNTSRIRLNITDSSGGPSIYEFQVFVAPR